MPLREDTSAPVIVPDSRAAAVAEGRLRVRWIGSTPTWVAVDGVGDIELDCSEPTSARRTRTTVGDAVNIFHIARPALGSLAALRHAVPDGVLVLDLSGEGDATLGWRSARQAAAADVVLAGSLSELRELRRRYPALAPRTALLRRPVDVDGEIPDTALADPTDAELAEFRRAHALTDPLILFVGPYTAAGGLDIAIEAVKALEGQHPDARFASILHGRLDRRYLRRCKRSARALGSRASFHSSPSATEAALWYAAARAICLPCREAVGAAPAKLAAAAGRPVVGAEVEPLLEHVDDGETGFLVPLGHFDLLVAGLDALLTDADTARRLGEAARERAERDFSPAAATRQLERVWTVAVERRLARAAARNGSAPAHVAAQA